MVRMRTRILSASAVFFLLAIASRAQASAPNHIDDYGIISDTAAVSGLRGWVSRLPAVAAAGRGFVGCSARLHTGPAQFNADFEACWSGFDRARSCSTRCGGPYHVFGYYAPSMSPGSIQFAILSFGR